MPKPLFKSQPATKPEHRESSQIDKFKTAARELDCDDDEGRFNERVKKLVKSRPAPSHKPSL